MPFSSIYVLKCDKQLSYPRSSFVITPICTSFKVGRKGCDFSINDASISRIHSILEANESNELWIEDCSKFGTYVNAQKIQKGSKKQLHVGDTIQFANFQTRFKVYAETTKVCTSNLSREERKDFKSLCTQYDIEIVSEFNEETHFLVMSSITATHKVFTALVLFRQIVTPSYFYDLINNNGTKCLQLSDYVPKVSENIINQSLAKFENCHLRLNLLKSLKFVFVDELHMKRLQPMLIYAGASCVLFNILTKEQKLVIMEDLKSDAIICVQSRASLNKSSFDSIRNRLSELSKRAITDCELGFCVLYCDRQNYCNPSSKVPSELADLDTTQRIAETYGASECTMPMNAIQNQLPSTNVDVNIRSCSETEKQSSADFNKSITLPQVNKSKNTGFSSTVNKTNFISSLTDKNVDPDTVEPSVNTSKANKGVELERLTSLKQQINDSNVKDIKGKRKGSPLTENYHKISKIQEPEQPKEVGALQDNFISQSLGFLDALEPVRNNPSDRNINVRDINNDAVSNDFPTSDANSCAANLKEVKSRTDVSENKITVSKKETAKSRQAAESCLERTVNNISGIKSNAISMVSNRSFGDSWVKKQKNFDTIRGDFSAVGSNELSRSDNTTRLPENSSGNLHETSMMRSTTFSLKRQRLPPPNNSDRTGSNQPNFKKFKKIHPAWKKNVIEEDMDGSTVVARRKTSVKLKTRNSTQTTF